MDANLATQREVVLLGRITGAHGIRGWVKVHSDTDPRDAIFNYQPWLVGAGHVPVQIVQGREQGKYLVAQLDGVNDRTGAEGLAGQDIAVFRDQLPDLPDTQFYWADLSGLKVIDRDGTELGVIREMLATGANDVMVVQGDREQLIPFVWGDCVLAVDLDKGQVTVDWDPGF